MVPLWVLLALDAIAAPLWAAGPRVIEGIGQLMPQFNVLAIRGRDEETSFKVELRN